MKIRYQTTRKGQKVTFSPLENTRFLVGRGLFEAQSEKGADDVLPWNADFGRQRKVQKEAKKKVNHSQYRKFLRQKLNRLNSGQYMIEKIARHLDLTYESTAFYLDLWRIPKAIENHRTYYLIDKICKS